MGATNFETSAKGQTADKAFNKAVKEAQYEHGHGGYTGTIAEKGNFILIDLPKGLDAKLFVRYVEDIDQDPERVPAEYKALAQRASKIWLDKWGPAVAVKDGPDRFVFFGLASC